jgi:uncharacterized lipoprotein YmbA
MHKLMLTKMLNGLLACLISSFLMTGCASTPPTHFYVLEAVSQPAAGRFNEAANKRQIGIGPISIPALLERKQMVTRTENKGVQIAEFHQWAAPLKDNIAQVIAHNLAALQPNDIIRSYPWSAFGAVEYRVVIDIQRFDSRPGQSVNFEASWAIMNEKNHKILTNGRSKIEQPLPDASHETSVKAFSALLGEFSQELSLALRTVRPL